MTAAGQVDRSVHERLPPPGQWPELRLPTHLQGRFVLNCATRLVDDHIAAGHGGRPAIHGDAIRWSFDELNERASRLARALVDGQRIVSGNRVLIRSPNSPQAAVIWLAIQKCGAVAVTTMSLLRSRELAAIIASSNPSVALCDAGMLDELTHAVSATGSAMPVLPFTQDADGLDPIVADTSAAFDTVATFSDDIALVGYTSGTTGRPKGTIHFHRDVIAVCETVADGVVAATPEDRFIGTSPLAFTFGLGGLVLFPLYAGASTVLYPSYTPERLNETIRSHRASVCFTVPSFYQRMARTIRGADAATLRMAVSSGEALPLKVRQTWESTTGVRLVELLGATEMLHAFVGPVNGEVRPGFIGRALNGYQAAVLDDAGKALPPGEIGRFAIKGPTGCRYLDDPRQTEYVQHGWNLTGDACSMDADGFVQYHARRDDLIISSGYNISGIEVENVLLEHPDVAECAVVGLDDDDRGRVVVAFVVPKRPVESEGGFAASLQDFVKAQLAPYKYPRRVLLLDALPRNESGKIQRYRLRSE